MEVNDSAVKETRTKVMAVSHVRMGRLRRLEMPSITAAMVAEKGFDELDAPIVRVGAPFTPVPFSLVLENAFIPDEEKLVEAVRTVMG